MTRDEILAMEPGPKMDEAVGKAIGATPTVRWYCMREDEMAYFAEFDSRSEAENWHNNMVMKSPDSRYVVNGGHIVRQEIYRQYSRDISTAWGVAEKMCKGRPYEISSSFQDECDVGIEGWLVTWGNIGGSGKEEMWAPTAPEAICKAALLTQEVPTNET